MEKVIEQELYCSVCGNTKPIPYCCGKEMDFVDGVFFCSSCGRETKVPKCCGKEMIIRNKVINLKKEIFGRII